MGAIFKKMFETFDVSVCMFVGTDPHQLEFPMEQFKLRHHLSGFHGSAGTLLVCNGNNKIHKAIWTDGRYELLAKSTVSPDTQVFISREDNWEEQITWINETLSHTKKQIRIGIPDIQISTENFLRIQGIINNKKLSLISIVLINYAFILRIIAETDITLWSILTSKRTSPSIFLLSEMQKIHPIESLPPLDNNHKRCKHLSDFIQAKNGDVYLSANVHELAWLTNLRAQSIEFLMVFPSLFAFHVSSQTLHLWILPSPIHARTLQPQIAHLERELHISILIHNYNNFLQAPNHIRGMLTKACKPHKHILYDLANTPQALFHKSYKAISSPLTLWKSIRSTIEIDHIKYAYHIDAVSLVEALAEIYELCISGKNTTEQDAADIVLQHKKKNPHFLQASFKTISATGKNAASPHYNGTTPSPHINPKEIFLLDCGVHYLYGSTDITRVYLFEDNKVSQEIKESYTHVLRAHIALARFRITVDPNNIKSFPLGKELDTIGRAKLIEHNKNFNHGIGHGIGYCTDVHEGIHRINPRSNQHFYPQMLVSNEPGYYQESQWGLRIENIMLSQVKNNTFYFETLSYVPIQTSLIDFSLMDKNEEQWVHSYHETCKQRLLPHISEKAKRFLNRMIS